jgi:uncharacterized iron-regulated membrane protein
VLTIVNPTTTTTRPTTSQTTTTTTTTTTTKTQEAETTIMPSTAVVTDTATDTVPAVDTDSSQLDTPALIGIIVGSVLGCLLLIALIAGIVVASKRRREPLEAPAAAPNQRTSQYATSPIQEQQYDKPPSLDSHHYDQAGSSLHF